MSSDFTTFSVLELCPYIFVFSTLGGCDGNGVYATFNNISIISWRSVLLIEETGVPEENNRPATSHWQTLSHSVVSSTSCHELDSNSSTLVVICVLWTNSSMFVLNFEQGNFSLMEKKFIQISTSKNYHVNDFDLILMHRFLCFRTKKRIKSWEEWKVGWWVK